MQIFDYSHYRICFVQRSCSLIYCLCSYSSCLFFRLLFCLKINCYFAGKKNKKNLNPFQNNSIAIEVAYSTGTWRGGAIRNLEIRCSNAKMVENHHRQKILKLILRQSETWKYKVFQKEWTDFELLSWPYYMQVFAETTFNVKDIVRHFMPNLYEPISFSPSPKNQKC